MKRDLMGTALAGMVLVGGFLTVVGSPRREASGPAWPQARSPHDRSCMRLTRTLPLSGVEDRGLRTALEPELAQYMGGRDWCSVRGHVVHSWPEGGHRVLITAAGYRFIFDCDGKLVGNDGCVLMEGMQPDEFTAFATGSRQE